MGTQRAKEIVLEPSKPEPCLVPETSIGISTGAFYADNALSEEWRQHMMSEGECDDGSQRNQRDTGTNQQGKYAARPERSAQRVPKPPKR